MSRIRLPSRFSWRWVHAWSWMAAFAVLLTACEASTVPPAAPTAQPSGPAVGEAAPVAAAQPSLPAVAEPLPEPLALPEPAIVEPVPAPTPAPEPAPAEVLPLQVEEAPSPAPGPISIGLLLPLSGPSAALGEALLDAAQLALFDVGSEGLVLLPKDTEGTPDGALRVAAEALAEGAAVILGPLFSSSVAAIAPLTRAAGVKVVAFSSDRSVAGEDIFLMGFIPHQQVERVVTYAVGQGLTRFAALTPDTPYGREMVEELRRVAAATGAQVVDVAYYLAGDPNPAAVVRRLARYEERHQALLAVRRELEAQDDELARRALQKLATLDTLGEVGFNAVLLPDSGARLRTVASYLPLFDVDLPEVRVLGMAEWEDPATLSEPSLVGGWLAAPPPQARARFETRFAMVYGRKPPRLASLAYDAVALVGALALLPNGPDFSVERLAAASGYRGVDGIFRFGPDGAAERGLAVFEVTAEGTKTVSAAPTSFEGLGYY